MSDNKAEGIAPRKRLEKEAINLAMQGKWQEAVAKNRAILDAFPKDVDAHNRLGRALTEMGSYEEAIEAYQKALEMDPHNSISKKNIARLNALDRGVVSKHASARVVPQAFVGEMGKVGIVGLTKLAPRAVLAKMAPGDEVDLHVKGLLAIAQTPQGEQLGEVELAHGPRLAKLMSGGNTYIAAVTSADDNNLRLIVKETFQHPSQEGKPSFPAKEADGFRAYVRDGLLRDEAVEPPEEEITYDAGWSGDEEGEEESERLPQGFSFVGGAATEEEE